MKKHNHFCVLKGDPVIPGANRTPEGMNFAVDSLEAKMPQICIVRVTKLLMKKSLLQTGIVQEEYVLCF